MPFDKLKYLMSVCNAPQPVNLAMIIAALERKGVDPRTFTLHMVNGILSNTSASAVTSIRQNTVCASRPT